MTHKENHQLQRKMTSRHLFMLSLGGVIGTGLFLSTGFTIGQAGGFGTLLSFMVGAVVVYLIMLCLGELAVHMPVTGSFHTYATRYIGPGTGFTMAWLYWLTWTVALGSESTALFHAKPFVSWLNIGFPMFLFGHSVWSSLLWCLD